MKRILVFFSLLIFVACSPEKKESASHATDDSRFDRYKENFVLQLWKLHPGWASGVGYHAYDSILTVPDSARRETELKFYAQHLDSLASFTSSQLTNLNTIDRQMMKDFLESSIWGIQTLKTYVWDPSGYNVCGGFAEMLNNNYDSLDTRLMNFHKRMAAIPAYYEAAKRSIQSPTLEHTDLAISQHLGGVSVFESDLQDAVKRSGLPIETKNALLERGKIAAAEVRGFADWLKHFKNEQPRSFRLGRDLYLQKFKYDIQSAYTADQIYEKALARKKELHQKMYAITHELWAKYVKAKVMPSDSLRAIRELIDVLSLRHAKADSFQTAIEQQIPTLVEFIKQKKLIYIDPAKPLVVRKEPAYMAGLAGASISSPGPYDKNGNTYYNVGSMHGWSKERAESYLREYNHYILQILNIHEAIPGHYTQLVYSNQSPSIIKSILGNGAMVEGWAVYTELMMLENGYGALPGSSVSEPEMWLMYYKWTLRSTCNTILDYNIHTKDLSKEDAIRFLTGEAFQQQAEAEGKWRRATLSQVQLCCYFTGFSEITALREELKQKAGAAFDLKQFHEKFLSYGSAPVKYIREMMLAENN